MVPQRIGGTGANKVPREVGLVTLKVSTEQTPAEATMVEGGTSTRLSKSKLKIKCLKHVIPQKKLFSHK